MFLDYKLLFNHERNFRNNIFLATSFPTFYKDKSDIWEQSLPICTISSLPAWKGGGKVRKRNSYWVSSYHLVRFISTINAFQELANQEMLETGIGA